ncbi:hypothetical protein AB1Y20_012644 [Prymnesium parvum]|uniref:Pyridoxal 5'-phosphate synthase n=1 Tax=Prymnesium parvum TaxID=97485 RepID=A0AB34IKF5_PRYPA
MRRTFDASIASIRLCSIRRRDTCRLPLHTLLLHRARHSSASLDSTHLALNPLDELRLRSAQRGLCDVDGLRVAGAPWGMQLAHASPRGEPWPVVRTVGFQTVQADGFTFLLKRSSGLATHQLPIAINYVEGRYTSGERCEQWRADGLATEVPVREVLRTAPLSSLAQILASHGAAGGEAQSTRFPTSQRGPAGAARTTLDDRQRFLERAAAFKAQLVAGDVATGVLDEAAIAYRCLPVRMELLSGGPDYPMWERFEWQRDDNGEWTEPRPLLPY